MRRSSRVVSYPGSRRKLINLNSSRTTTCWLYAYTIYQPTDRLWNILYICILDTLTSYGDIARHIIQNAACEGDALRPVSKSVKCISQKCEVLENMINRFHANIVTPQNRITNLSLRSTFGRGPTSHLYVCLRRACCVGQSKKNINELVTRAYIPRVLGVCISLSHPKHAKVFGVYLEWRSLYAGSI